MGDEQTIGSYVLEERFAVGGMAEIFRARREGPGGFSKRVALKRLLPDLNRDPEFVAMFLEEARLASQINSPNLVQVFDFGEAGGAYFLAMEYVDGLDLSALVTAAGAPPVDLAVFVGMELCRALEALAALGIVHRDVNPANVLVSTRGEVKLGDFGIAKARARSLRTEKGAIKGKLAYLSPEQARGDEADARTDLYGAGLVLFELLTAQRFLPSGPEAQMLVAAANPAWRAPSNLRSGLPRELDEIVRRALSTIPAERYPDAGHLRRALEKAVPEIADAPRRLGELVQGARQDAACATPAIAPTTAAVPTGAEARASAPKTERLARPAGKGRSAARWTVLGLSAVACAVAGAFLLWPQPSPSPRPVEVAPNPKVEPAAAVVNPTPAVEPRAVVARPMPDPKPRPALIRPSPRETNPPAPIVAASPIAKEDPQPVPPAAPTFEPEVAAIEHALKARGLLHADAPELFAAHQQLAFAVAQGKATAAEVAELRARVDSFAIDRAFIEKKLQRLQRQLEKSTLAEPARQELFRRSQAALSHSVTGHYPQANAELNAIASMLER